VRVRVATSAEVERHEARVALLKAEEGTVSIGLYTILLVDL